MTGALCQVCTSLQRHRDQSRVAGGARPRCRYRTTSLVETHSRLAKQWIGGAAKLWHQFGGAAGRNEPPARPWLPGRRRPAYDPIQILRAPDRDQRAEPSDLTWADLARERQRFRAANHISGIWGRVSVRRIALPSAEPLTDPCELFEMTAFSPPSSGMPTVQVTPAEGGSNTSSY
jgi:hypothetical protein